ncbi:hypothetical protein TNCV_3598841 [Trichonephila clavipes]|nr:hypothetical protein TNCV_3598841 [Trichonephila clavipes]
MDIKLGPHRGYLYILAAREVSEQTKDLQVDPSWWRTSIARRTLFIHFNQFAFFLHWKKRREVQKTQTFSLEMGFCFGTSFVWNSVISRNGIRLGFDNG